MPLLSLPQVSTIIYSIAISDRVRAARRTCASSSAQPPRSQVFTICYDYLNKYIILYMKFTVSILLLSIHILRKEIRCGLQRISNIVVLLCKLLLCVRLRIGYAYLMIVPLSFCSDQRTVKFLIQRRYRNVKSINLLRHTVAVGYLILCRLQ